MIIRDKSIKKHVFVTEKECINFQCYHPHDCPIQGSGGVRNSKERYMCLTNFYKGCPKNPLIKDNKKG